MSNLELVYSANNSIIIRHIFNDGMTSMFIEKPYLASKDQWRKLRDGIVNDQNAEIKFTKNGSANLNYKASTTSFRGEPLEGIIEYEVFSDGAGCITILLYKEEYGQKFVNIINQIIANDALWNHKNDI